MNNNFVNENINNNTNNGGNLFGNKINVYLSIIILSYFLIKTIFSSFGIYPDKFYNRNFTLNSNSKNNMNNVINSFVPGVWNSEMNDLIITLILVLIIFFFKSNSNFPMNKGSLLNFSLWVPFFIALIIEPMRVYTLSRDEDNYKIFLFIELIVIVSLFLGRNSI